MSSAILAFPVFGQQTVIDWGDSDNVITQKIFLREGANPVTEPVNYTLGTGGYNGDNTLNLALPSSPPTDVGTGLNTADDYYVDATGKTPVFHAVVSPASTVRVGEFNIADQTQLASTYSQSTADFSDAIHLLFQRPTNPGPNEGVALVYWDAATTGLTLNSLSAKALRNNDVTENGLDEFRWMIRLGDNFYVSENTGAISADAAVGFDVRTLSNPNSLAWYSYNPVADVLGSLGAEPVSGLDFSDFRGAGIYFYANEPGRGYLGLYLASFQAVASESGNPATWAGYDVDANNDANTQGWLGWVNVTHKPVIWSYSLQGWIYVPENAVSNSGGWAYLFK